MICWVIAHSILGREVLINCKKSKYISEIIERSEFFQKNWPFQGTFDLKMTSMVGILPRFWCGLWVNKLFSVNFLPLGLKARGYCNLMITVSVCPHLHFLHYRSQFKSDPYLLTWWMVLGRGWCLLLDVTVRWSQPFCLTAFYLKYDVFIYFSRWR